MQSRAARSAILSAGVGAAATATGVAAPRLAQAVGPSFLDSAVPVGLVIAAVLLLGRHEWLAAHLLAWSATFWSLTGVAGSLAGPLEPLLSRLALVPHALVLGALLALPYGDLVGRRRVLAVAALVVALVAGAGIAIPTLLLIGTIPVVASVDRARGVGAAEAVATRIALLVIGAGWASLWLLGERLSVHAVANGVALLLLGSAVAVVQIMGRGEVATELGTELGRRVGAVLGLSPVDVLFPVADDPSVALDVEGRRRPLPPATPVAAGGATVAWISPPVTLGPGTERVLAAQLKPLAAMAALDDSWRRQAALLDESRRRLAAAADEERQRVQKALTRTVTRRLNSIEGLLDEASPPYAELVRVRGELTGLVNGIDPLRGRTLGEALLALRDRVAEVDASAALDAAPGVAQSAWWVVAEAVANALKHAPGSRVVVRARREGLELVVEVHDEGPGGADPAGRGLLGIADRAAVVGGRLDVRSDAGGTTVRAVLPTGWPVLTPRSGPDPRTPAFS